jgi:hypothetical protein
MTICRRRVPYRLLVFLHCYDGLGASREDLRNRWAEQVATEVLEPRAVARRRRNVGVQVESVQERLARCAGGDPRRVGIAAEP